MLDPANRQVHWGMENAIPLHRATLRVAKTDRRDASRAKRVGRFARRPAPPPFASVLRGSLSPLPLPRLA